MQIYLHKQKEHHLSHWWVVSTRASNRALEHSLQSDWLYSGVDFSFCVHVPYPAAEFDAATYWNDPWNLFSTKFSSVAQSCLTLCEPMDHSTPGLPIHHQLLEFTQTHVHWLGNAIQPSHPLSSSLSPPAFNLSQHQGLFKWVSSSHQVAKVLEFQPHHQSFQ